MGLAFCRVRGVALCVAYQLGPCSDFSGLGLRGFNIGVIDVKIARTGPVSVEIGFYIAARAPGAKRIGVVEFHEPSVVSPYTSS